MTKHAITLLPGDGVGPEICDASVRVLEATGVEFDWDVQPAGESAMTEYGTPLPPRTLDSIRRTKVALKGPVGTPIGTGFRSVNVALRQSSTFTPWSGPSRPTRALATCATTSTS